jgi:hypothetical protein
MARGGIRPGAGGKSKWIHGKTTVIRVPEILAADVLLLAQLLDQGKTVDDVTQSKYLNLSGITIRSVGDKPAVLLEDLLKAGFKIRPLGLVDKLRKQLDRIKVNV